MAWRFHEHIVRGELDNTVRGRVTGRIWLAGVAEPMTLELRGDCAPDLAGCTFAFSNPHPIPLVGPAPNLAQRGWVGDITASQRLRVFDLPEDEALALIRSGREAPSHFANALYLEWHSTTNGGVTIQTAAFQLTISAPAWTLTPAEYRASREASGREFIEWSQAEFGWTNEDRAAVEDGGDAFDEEEGEEWKRDDDEAAQEDDTLLIFDPIEHAEWMPARAILIKYGFTPLRPSEVSADHLRGRLWELIYALAGRRIFLNSTDHLSDRALYEWLDTFLEMDCADCPLEAETNYRVDASDGSSGSDTGLQTWLRFFADEKERAQWLRDFPDCPMPPREKPAYARDALLPEPPNPFGPPPEEEPASSHLASDDWQRPMEELAQDHAAPLPPDELTDEALPPHLWNLLHHLACRGFYVLHTDHLSDRALYETLWKKGLRKEAILPGRSRTGGFFYDTIGSYGPEDLEILHHCYESEKDRTRRLAEFPNSTLPPRERPPFSRDWRLPKGPF